MVKGSVTARAVTLEDLLSDLKVIDKKKISLGYLELDISEPSKRTLEEELEEKYKNKINKEENNIDASKSVDVNFKKEEKKIEENEDKEEKKNKDELGEDDLII